MDWFNAILSLLWLIALLLYNLWLVGCIGKLKNDLKKSKDDSLVLVKISQGLLERIKELEKKVN